MAAVGMPTTTGFAAASLEPCGGCIMQTCRSSNPTPRGFHSSGLRSGKGFSNTGITEFRELNNHRRNKSRQQQRLQIVQQAAPPTFNFPDKQTVKKLETGLPDLSEYNNLTARNFTNGATTPSPPAIAREKLSLFDIVAPVSDDLLTLNNNLQTVVGSENAMLMAAARQIFGAGGKRMRPAVVFLVSRATSDLYGHQDIRPQHRRLAEITEMIHTASLIHDDVLDESDTRRGKQTVHQIFGTRVAVLAGDFMFAQSSWYLANLDNLEVIKLISQVIRDFANGEIKQAQSLFNCDVTLQDYMDKSYYKTASLIAASTRSAAIFSGSSPKVCDQMFQYGMQLGLAFQIVDDILDFTQTSEQLGKPAGSDLAKGNLTAPVLFALKTEPQLRELIDTEFTEEGSLEFAISLVHQGGGIENAQELAKQKGELALKSLDCLPQGACRQSLEKMVDYVLERIS